MTNFRNSTRNCKIQESGYIRNTLRGIKGTIETDFQTDVRNKNVLFYF